MSVMTEANVVNSYSPHKLFGMYLTDRNSVQNNCFQNHQAIHASSLSERFSNLKVSWFYNKTSYYNLVQEIITRNKRVIGIYTPRLLYITIPLPVMSQPALILHILNMPLITVITVIRLITGKGRACIIITTYLEIISA